MKFQINVELLKNGKAVSVADLKAFGPINFVKAAPKAFKRAMKATCWPFDANIDVSLVNEPKTGKKQHGRKRKKDISKNRG